MVMILFWRDVIYWLGLLHSNDEAREQPVQAQTYTETPLPGWHPSPASTLMWNYSLFFFFLVWRVQFRRSNSIFCPGSGRLLQHEDGAVELPFYLAFDSCSFRWASWEEPPRLHVLTDTSAPVCASRMMFFHFILILQLPFDAAIRFWCPC